MKKKLAKYGKKQYNKVAIKISPKAIKQIKKLPGYIINAFEVWKLSVELEGIEVVRKTKAYHDEALKGKRHGQRSVRLNRSYRLIYVEDKKDLYVLVLEVNKHDY